jgi:hypothetical protein
MIETSANGGSKKMTTTSKIDMIKNNREARR